MRALEWDFIANLVASVALFTACGRVDKSNAPPSTEPMSQAGEPSGQGASNEPASGGTPSVDAVSGAGAGGASPPSMSDQLLPWRVGNRWTYRVTEQDELKTEKTTSIGPTELVGGTGPNANIVANLVSTTETNGEVTESWQAPSLLSPARIVRFRERDRDSSTANLVEAHYDPEKLHVDDSLERTQAGATWVESYEETVQARGFTTLVTAYRERWTVESDDETVTVPAGTFTGVVHFRKEGATQPKHYWYARGVGKIREEGTQTVRVEELLSYHLEP